MIFKSKLRRRIEKEINSMLSLRIDITIHKMKLINDPKEYSRIMVKDMDLRDKINLLERLLNRK